MVIPVVIATVFGISLALGCYEFALGWALSYAVNRALIALMLHRLGKQFEKGARL